MGGGPKIVGNPENIKEDDAELSSRIRPIELIKHNPQLFHMNFFDVGQQYEILGGYKTFAMQLLGGVLAFAYFRGGRATRSYNYYTDVHGGFFRFFFGAAVGTGIGYLKFGDRQKMHNAYVAERLRKRYPASIDLHASDLWQYKGVPASHSFYQWK